MARITVNDCLKQVPDRFELVILAAERARQLGAGERCAIERSDEPRPVLALREIAAGIVPPETLRDRLIGALQRYRPEDDEPEDEMAAPVATAEPQVALGQEPPDGPDPEGPFSHAA